MKLVSIKDALLVPDDVLQFATFEQIQQLIEISENIIMRHDRKDAEGGCTNEMQIVDIDDLDETAIPIFKQINDCIKLGCFENCIDAVILGKLIKAATGRSEESVLVEGIDDEELHDIATLICAYGYFMGKRAR